MKNEVIKWIDSREMGQHDRRFELDHPARDPTANAAIARIMREARKKPSRKMKPRPRTQVWRLEDEEKTNDGTDTDAKRRP